MSDSAKYLLLLTIASYLLGLYTMHRITRPKMKAMQYRAEQMWLGQQQLWKQYQELLKHRTQP